MDLLSLRYFREVARREHISRAAEELRVAQPSVSRTIARLEAELGVRLFDRQGRAIRLNRHGAAFLTRVERALDELDDARREMADAAGLDDGSLAVAAETLLPLTELLAAFRAAHPGVTLRCLQSTPEVMRAQLRARDVDFCFASQPLSGPGLGAVRLLREEVLLAVPAGHPLAARERVTVAEIADEPFITTRQGNWQRALLERLFTAIGRRPVISCEGDEPGATHFLIAAGLGIGLIPALARPELPHVPLAWLHLDTPDCVRTLDLVRREDSYLSTAARRFRAMAVAHFAAREHPARPGQETGAG
ncbi:LysR family transcriptional regulator [Streptomyces angustmyceticus]|uniref:Transcriptional regulator n=1 Tax=Streptomyces angustmyceticus TaxID=285578 RepID=A0A5J4L9T9_9ACTN|nr:LysR family transcriptional regulator [Streptomyces angustmyceticus]UAL66238.1 LysR family transcriptional regulator [Streptomyces angustmyceticus]GES29002.1 transcriptional regulator [Streptomyces angustmyceticus]